MFGIAGGYLRYLYKTAKIRTFDKEIQDLRTTTNKIFSDEYQSQIDKLKKDRMKLVEIQKLGESSLMVQKIDTELSGLMYAKEYRYRSGLRKLIFYRSIEDLSLLFLSPLLAIAIWFVLDQWQTTASNVKNTCCSEFYRRSDDR